MREAGNLEHLRTFITVHRAGSLTEAAKLLGIAQPTVSAHIHSLESALGFALFVRSHSGVTATAKAQELAAELAGHIDAIDDIAALSDTSVGAARALHIGGPAELLGEMVVPRIRELGNAVEAPLWFTFGLADGLLDELRVGAVDLVVSAVMPRLSGISATPLYDEEFVLVAAPEWAAAAAKVALQVVGAASHEPWASIPLIAYAGNMPIVRRYWRSVFNRRPDALTLAAVVPDLRSIRSAVLSGAGMSVLPHYLVANDLARGALVLLHTPQVAPLNTVHLATRSGELSRSPQLRALVDELRRIIR